MKEIEELKQYLKIDEIDYLSYARYRRFLISLLVAFLLGAGFESMLGKYGGLIICGIVIGLNLLLNVYLRYDVKMQKYTNGVIRRKTKQIKHKQIPLLVYIFLNGLIALIMCIMFYQLMFLEGEHLYFMETFKDSMVAGVYSVCILIAISYGMFRVIFSPVFFFARVLPPDVEELDEVKEVNYDSGK